MSRSRDLANLAGDATGLETITVSDITDLTASAAELNKLDGVTADTAEINKLDGVTADAAELNKLDGVTASTAELNYVDGVTSAVQTQLTQLDSQTSPHIIPGVLYPAVGGNDIHGNDIDTSHGSTYTYGATHTDGRKYYYTDIKGSKPIKDPRIGGHFGSQRHKIKSLQLLEQETATQGNEVYSLDGRKWLRLNATTTPLDFNRADGRSIGTGASGGVNSYFEIVGYFSDMNLVGFTQSSDRGFNVKVDGGTATAENNSLQPSINSPLGTASAGRYVDAGAVVNLGLNQTLGIHTVRVTPHASGDYVILYGVELIAQDTTSTANKSKIQIPSQDVVSYGKKFTVSGTPHYDPFSAKTDGSAWTSPTSGTNNVNSSASWPTNIDTATSLGLDKWVDGSNYYRPYNGARVVHWVDSSGTIKTSVTVMPPNAKSIKSADVNKKAKNAPNDTYLPTFEDETTDVNEDNLHEVAKTFHFREFGNGSANGGTGGTYADASMLNTADDISYVMDDGLTSLSASGVDILVTPANAINLGSTDYVYITFIGTGISVFSPNWAENATAWNHIAQNLPYGTHILKITRVDSTNSTITLDGVSILGNTATAPWKNPSEITIHQPKKPPIPEEAVILADFMLMADFVPQTTAGLDKVSKGTRKVAVSRDVFFTGEAMSVLQSLETDSGWIFYLNSSGTNASTKLRIPSFGTNFVKRGFHDRSTLFIGDSSQSSNQTASTGSAAHGDTHRLTANQVLGVYNFGSNPNDGANGITSSFEIVSPIHTSSHYQSFETPFLHELVGGDRNMEQTNLVCSPDGKIWDEVTRDTSYIGNVVVNTNTDQGGSIFDEWRGTVGADITPLFNKDWAIAYDRIICLKSGMYQINAGTLVSNGHQKIFVNTTSGSNYLMQNHDNTGNASVSGTAVYHFQRGDYIYVSGYNSSSNYNSFSIIKV